MRERAIPANDPLRLVLGERTEIPSGGSRTKFVLGDPTRPIISESVIEAIRNSPIPEESRKSLLDRAEQLNNGIDVELDVPRLPEGF